MNPDQLIPSDHAATIRVVLDIGTDTHVTVKAAPDSQGRLSPRPQENRVTYDTSTKGSVTTVTIKFDTNVIIVSSGGGPGHYLRRTHQQDFEVQLPPDAQIEAEVRAEGEAEFCASLTLEGFENSQVKVTEPATCQIVDGSAVIHKVSFVEAGPTLNPSTTLA